MMTETNEYGDKQSESGDAGSTGNFPSCGPGCGCREPAGKGTTKIKIAICLAVVGAIVGVLLFKTTSAKQNAPVIGTKGFSNPLASAGNGAVLNSSGQQGGSGASLSAIAELNVVAAKLDTVFLLIPGKDNAPATKEAGAALAAVERTLNAKGLSTGIYTLETASPDYPDVAAKVKAPGVAVLTKGRGIGFSSGSISETSLMQAYVASTRGGGCCPPGGSAPGKPCN